MRAAVNKIVAYRRLFVWVKVWAFHTSHQRSDDEALVLTHSGCIARGRSRDFKV